jgi:hypothetical protein
MEESELRRGGEEEPGWLLDLERLDGDWPIRYATRARQGRPGEAVAIREPRGRGERIRRSGGCAGSGMGGDETV